ncbi:ABC1 kinase family protein [Streptomyces sp. NPDC056190]|uniref:ABC1 kinase family protein n=1 Tax=Streptomyces sp. NPDC056190 TaxID=3345741 RepID=UPI0035E17EF0
MWLMGVLAGVVVLALPAVIGRRLLGVQAGPLRLAFAGFVGIAVAGGLIGPRLQDEGEQPVLLPVMAGISLLTAMLALVVVDRLVPDGGLRPLDLLTSLRARYHRVRRYSEVARILGRHGLGPYLRGRKDPQGASAPVLAAELRQALQAGGATFVKLGQVLSTRRDLLSEPYIEELSRLQDRVPPAPWSEVEGQVREGLGRPMDEVFASFDREPLAAASIAQAHAAILKDGTEVVVKVRRPGITDVVEPDLDIVGRLAVSLSRRAGWGRSLGLVELAEGFSTALREELDFRVEARNLAAVRRASATRGDDSVALPMLYEEWSSATVLVMSRLPGVSLGKGRPGDAGQGDKLADTLLTALLNQIMLDGIFHADPHPGNIMLQPDGRPALLDFGSVGRLDAGLRDALAGLFLAVEQGDPAALRDALLEVAERPEEVDEQRLQRALGQFSARHLGHGGAPDVTMFTELFQLVAAFRLAVPPEIAAVFRALATLEGTLVRLAPGFDILRASRSYASARLTEQLRPGGAGEQARAELVAALPVLRRLPRRIDRIGGALEEGRLGVNVRLFADARDRRVVTELVGRILLTVVGVFFGLTGVLLLGADGGPRVNEGLTLYELIGYNLLVLSGVVMLRVLYVLSRPVS